MKNRILENINDPIALEKLYRNDKKAFSKAFREVYPDIAENETAAIWKARLEYGAAESDGGITTKDILFLVLSCAFAGFFIKLPAIFNFSAGPALFYERNAVLIVFVALSLYAVLTGVLTNKKHILIAGAVFILSAVYVNILPRSTDADSLTLVYLHLRLLLWFLYGLVYANFDLRDKSKHMDYIKYNGDLLILSALIAIAVGMLAGASMELFSTIGLKIGDLYVEYVILIGAVSLPVVATFLLRKFAFITNRIAPLIASIFSPLVLITLLVYLISMLITGKDPYNDREFLLIFNIMLLGVLAIVVFSVSETGGSGKRRFNGIVLFALALVALIVDLIALSAIFYRLGEFGLSPNRVAVLGSNLLVLAHLILITKDLYRVNFRNENPARVEKTVAAYLPVYAVWGIFVVFVLPLIFGYK